MKNVCHGTRGRGLGRGLATTAEIGAVAAVYAAAVSAFVYREAGMCDLWRALCEAAADSAKALIIVSISGGFVWIIASLGVARDLAALIVITGLEGAALLALIVLVLLLLGTVLEPITLIVVVVPLLVPAAQAGGIDLVHRGIVAVLSASIGLVTPPVGILLYFTAAQAQPRTMSVITEMLPFLIALIAILAPLVLLTGLVLWLPGTVGRVRRETDPANARRNMWELTENDWSLFDLILPAALERDRKAFTQVSEEEKKRLMALLRDFEL